MAIGRSQLASTRAATKSSPACLRCVAVSVRPSAGRSLSVAVRAFRDSQRTKQLVGVAREFATAWATCSLKGPSGTPLANLKQLCDHSVVLHSAHPLGCTSAKGPDAVAAKLGTDFDTYFKSLSSDASNPDDAVLAVAVNETRDIAFALLHLPLAKDGSQEQQHAHVVLKMDVMLDDSSREVTSVLERGLLPTALKGATPSSSGTITPATAPGSATHEELDKGAQVLYERGSKHKEGEGLECQAPVKPFPHSFMKPWAGEAGSSEKEGLEKGASYSRPPAEQAEADPTVKAAKVMKEWTMAWDSSTDAATVLSKNGILESDSVHWFDAYGQKPPMHHYDPNAPHEHGDVACGQAEVLDAIQSTKESYEVKQDLVDWAVSSEYAIGFTHWSSHLKSKKSDASWEMDGIEALLMDPSSGKLLSVYTWQDVMHQKKSG
ncbi:hypothetical protein QJQ45_002777 [Haematococcus lacustris]|nr:hypothetical protein QJQ45_002777 [Haematococcus lacustris]